MYLLDTNIFLEILLGQEKKTVCKNFLDENTDNLSISDFTLHSIGVILFKNKKEEVFKHFIDDILPKIEILSLPGDSYHNVLNLKKSFNLDFDDSYQYSVAIHYGIKVVTLDNDFMKVKDTANVLLL